MKKLKNNFFNFFVLNRKLKYNISGDEIMKIIIVGGVAGGATAAARLRRLNENAEIIIFERTNFISYATCGLPYHISNVIKNREKLTLQTPKSFLTRFNIVAKTNHEVLDVNSNEKHVTVRNLLTDEVFIESYDKLILSPGAKPIIPSFFTLKDRTFILRTVEDTFKIKSYLEETEAKSATIIGGGYIGIEMTENLRKIGLEVNLIEANSQVLRILDNDMASFVHSKLNESGVNLYLKEKVKNVLEENNHVTIVLENDKKIISDFVILAIGVTPDINLASLAGLELGINNSIVVDEHMQTSNEDIYAVGDAVEVKNYITGEKTLIPLAGPANKQGRIAADNICGIPNTYKGSLGTSIIKVFDLVVATTGINESLCKKNNIDYEKVILSPLSHAGYYPDAKVLTIKVIYEKKTLKILGAQIVGYDGVDKRIDVLATAIKANIKATELKDLELAYAPPFSQAKDPINLAGFIIDNIENGIVKQFYYEDIKVLKQRDDVVLLDTRTTFEYSNGFAEGFINIPLDNLRDRLVELDKNKKIYVMCQSGLRSYLATRILVQNGFDAYNFAGGYLLYSLISKSQ